MVKIISGIYCIICTKNGKYYVGSAKDLLNRKKEHFSRLKNKNHENPHLQFTYDLYGENKFIFLIIESDILEENLLKVEQTYLDIAKTEKDKVFNISFIAGGGKVYDIHPFLNKHHKKETCQKISDSLKERYKNGYVTPNKGISHKEESNEKNKQSWIKKYENGYICPNIGKKATLETRKKQSISAIGKHNKEKNSNFDFNIYKFKNEITGEIFEGTRYDFYIKYNLQPQKIYELIKKTRKRHKKWILI